MTTKYEYCFVHISTTDDTHNYIIPRDDVQWPLITKDYPEKLVSGFYDLSVHNEITDCLCLTAEDNVKFLFGVAHYNLHQLEDFANGISNQDSANKTFDLCGLLLEKNRVWKGSKQKRIYKLLTLGKAIVNVEVWYDELTAAIPKLYDCIIIKNCFVNHTGMCINTRRSQPFQWAFVREGDFVKYIFQQLLNEGEVAEIAPKNPYFYKNYKNFKMVSDAVDIEDWDEWLRQHAYRPIPLTKDSELILVKGTPTECHYVLSVPDFEDESKIKRTVVRVMDNDTEKNYDIYVEEPAVLGIDDLESAESLNMQLKQYCEVFSPKEFICTCINEKLVLLSIA